jgi:hypothetical protein
MKTVIAIILRALICLLVARDAGDRANECS